MSEYGKYHRICKSLAGEEIFRGHAFGSDPNRLVCCLYILLTKLDFEILLV